MNVFSNLFKKKVPSLEQQLADLAACGVRLTASTTPAALLSEWPAAEFEEQPYLLAAIALGSDEERLSENLWHFDTECVEDHGDSARIAEHMRDLAAGDLPLEEIEDYVDVEGGQASLSVTLDGQRLRCVPEVDGDWVDPEVLSWFATLLADRNTGRRFTYLDTGGQDCVIGCFTADELERLREKTGLNWEWLT